MDVIRGTFQHFLKNFLNLVARLGRNLSAINIQLILIFLDGPLGGNLSLIDDIHLIAHNHHNNLTQIEMLIWV